MNEKGGIMVSGINLDDVERSSSGSESDYEEPQQSSGAIGINSSLIMPLATEDEDEVKKLTKDEIKITQTLELKGDFYSLTFYGLYLDTDDEELAEQRCEENEEKNELDVDDKKDQIKLKWAIDIKKKFRTQRNTKNFFKLMQIFCLQVILMFALLYSFFIGRFLDGTLNVDEVREEDTYPYITFLSKFSCAVLIHINMQPKIEEAIQRFQYIRHHPHKFEKVLIALIICFMKIFVEFMVELINLALTALQKSAIEVVMNYVALASISELDEIYYNTIKSPLKD